jgi:hypothetical protein
MAPQGNREGATGAIIRDGPMPDAMLSLRRLDLLVTRHEASKPSYNRFFNFTWCRFRMVVATSETIFVCFADAVTGNAEMIWRAT